MRISEPEVKKRQGAHRAVTCVSFLVIFVCLNLLLNFLFEPFLGSGAEMWKYFRAKDSLDLVYVGSSQCISALKPDAVDAVLGTRSYNMGSNMQSFHNSCLAVKAAAEEKGVKRVVFVVDYEMLGSDRYENFRAEASFEKAYESGLSPFLRLTAACGFLTDPAFFGKPGSVSYFFPWVYDRDMSIRSNVREKLAGRVLDESGHRDAEGFYPSDEIMVPDDFYISPAQAKEWDATAAQIIDLSLSDSNRADLVKLASYCRKEGIELTAISVPYPNWLRIYSLDTYKKAQQELTDLFAEYGFSYYDFNTVDSSYYTAALTGYKDNGHMNTAGAEAFSRMLAAFLKEAETEDMSGLFVPLG
ncbi:MAG: hypothetical protein LKJ76_05715 [Lachnospiraceae bacterium]|jgi:hypothetical protein|nr:hypothetical protein [Lachnospiraceae bacterium]